MKRIFFLIITCIMSNIAFSQEGRIASKGLAVDSPKGAFHTHEFTRHAVDDDDVLVEILYSGICHSDLHQVHGDWMPGSYPMVPGHEIAGRVAAVGKNVTKFKVGDLAGVGITTYSPIMFSHVKKGDKVGVAGFGGLGHMAVQYAVSFGTDVTVFDVTEEKREAALRMRAARYVNVNNPEELKGLNNISLALSLPVTSR